MFKHLLVPLDIDSPRETILQQSCALALSTQGRITFYHAKPTYFPAIMAGDNLVMDNSVYTLYSELVNTQSENLLAEAARFAQAQGVAYSCLSDEWDAPYEGIIAAAQAQQCDLIIMSSHGRRGVSAVLMGSETQKVLTHCKIPVLVLR